MITKAAAAIENQLSEKPQGASSDATGGVLDSIAVKVFTLTAGIAILALAVGWYWHGFDADEYENLQFSWLLGHGYVPYKQFFQNHPPLFHSVLSLFTRNLTCPLNSSILLATRIASLGAALLILRSVYKLSSLFVSRTIASWTAVLALLMCPFCMKFVEFRADWVSELCVVLGVLSVLRGFQSSEQRPAHLSFLLGGLLFGISFDCSQKSLAFIAGLGIWFLGTIVFTSHKLQRISYAALCGVGIGIGMSIVLIPIWCSGAGTEFIQQTILISRNFPRTMHWQEIWPEVLSGSLGLFALSFSASLDVLRRLKSELEQASPISLVFALQILGVIAFLQTPVPYHQSVLFFLQPWNALLAGYGLNRVLAGKNLFFYVPTLAITSVVCILPAFVSWPILSIVKVSVAWSVVASICFLCSRLSRKKQMAVCASILLVLPVYRFADYFRNITKKSEFKNDMRVFGHLADSVPGGKKLISMRAVVPFRDVHIFRPMIDPDLVKYVGAETVEKEYLDAVGQHNADYFIVAEYLRDKFPVLSDRLNDLGKPVLRENGYTLYQLDSESSGVPHSSHK